MREEMWLCPVCARVLVMHAGLVEGSTVRRRCTCGAECTLEMGPGGKRSVTIRAYGEVPGLDGRWGPMRCPRCDRDASVLSSTFADPKPRCDECLRREFEERIALIDSRAAEQASN